MASAGENVVVVGLARSGIAAAALPRPARRLGGGRRPEAARASCRRRRWRCARPACAWSSARTARRRFERASLVVVSPGVPWELAELEAARQRGRPGDRRDRARLPPPEGPGGRGHRHQGQVHHHRRARRDAARGRHGRARGRQHRRAARSASSRARRRRPRSRSRSRASSSRASSASGPHVAVWLNLSPDHLDRHPTLEAYVAAKARIFANQRPEDWAVVNADDPVVLAEARRARARQLLFRVTGEPLAAGDGAYFDEGAARLRQGGHEETLFARADVVLPGAHLAGDLLVAAAAARLLGAPADAIARAVRGFRGVEHVLEHVADDRRRRLLQRLEGHQRRGRAPQPRGLQRARGADPRRALQGRRLRRAAPVASRPRPCCRGDRRSDGTRRCRSRGDAPSRARPRRSGTPSFALARLRTPGRRRAARARLLLLRHVQGLRRARPRVQGRGQAPLGRRQGRGGCAWLGSSAPTCVLLGTTLALLRLRPGDGVERLVGARAGAPRQPLLLPAEAGGLGHARARRAGAGAAARLQDAAPPGRRLPAADRLDAAADRGAVPAVRERHAPLDPARRAQLPARRARQARRSCCSSRTTSSGAPSASTSSSRSSPRCCSSRGSAS